MIYTTSPKGNKKVEKTKKILTSKNIICCYDLGVLFTGPCASTGVCTKHFETRERGFP